MIEREIKVALIGNSGVGKTCIIQRFKDNTFNDYSDSTISASSVDKEIISNPKCYFTKFWMWLN